jgi:hypothetical protein
MTLPKCSYIWLWPSQIFFMCSWRSVNHVKAKHWRENGPMIATVIHLERKEHPPAFICSSPVQVLYCLTLETHLLREHQTLLCSVLLHYSLGKIHYVHKIYFYLVLTNEFCNTCIQLADEHVVLSIFIFCILILFFSFFGWTRISHTCSLNVPIITQESKIMFWSQTRQMVWETISLKNSSQKRLAHQPVSPIIK